MWYLFLQVFGENKFELPPIGELNQDCSFAPTLILSGDSLAVTQQNERDRLFEHIQALSFDWIENPETLCIAPEFFPVAWLVEGNRLMGRYELTPDDVDRAIIESELLRHLLDESR